MLAAAEALAETTLDLLRQDALREEAWAAFHAAETTGQ
jgi:hypothetical protein